MKTNTPVKTPTATELKAILGETYALWQKVIGEVAQVFPLLRQEWKPSKLPFGRVCLLKAKDRTLLYLIPATSIFEISVVLGERAVAIALGSDLPDDIKSMISVARQYAEGRGIRFAVSSIAQVPAIRKLVLIKTTPR